MLKPISAAAEKVLRKLFAGMEPGTSKRIDNAPGVYMFLSVERLTSTRYSMAHYFESNGDLVADPDCEFVDYNGKLYAIALQLSTGHYTRAINLDENDAPKTYSPSANRDVNSFVTMWVRNLRAQQGV